MHFSHWLLQTITYLIPSRFSLLRWCWTHQSNVERSRDRVETSRTGFWHFQTSNFLWLTSTVFWRPDPCRFSPKSSRRTSRFVCKRSRHRTPGTRDQFFHFESFVSVFPYPAGMWWKKKIIFKLFVFECFFFFKQWTASLTIQFLGIINVRPQSFSKSNNTYISVGCVRLGTYGDCLFGVHHSENFTRLGRECLCTGRTFPNVVSKRTCYFHITEAIVCI